GIVALIDAGTAGEDPTLTIEQAQDASGTGAKALTFEDIYVKSGADVQAVGQFTKVTQTAASTYVDATHAEVEKMYYVEFDDEDLDVANGFTHVRARIADVGTGAQIGAILYLLLDATHASDVGPTAID
ncbi:MAG: hypothetical protein R3344_07135, partial [Acidobacteriota bacterium]|nr:hypothetical protein [Acidobacteriota bacterium]